MTASRSLYALLSALVVGLVLWLGVPGLWHRTIPPPAIAGIFFVAPKTLEDFSLRDHTGAAFQRDRLLGKWTWLYFGYTSCPDACPLTLTTFTQVHQRLGRVGSPADHAYVLISVDPARDTLERLGVYTTYFHPTFLGVTGDPEELTRLAQQCLVLYRQAPDQQSAGLYTVDHSLNIVLIDPQARLRAIFRPPHLPETLATDWHNIQAYAQAHP